MMRPFSLIAAALLCAGLVAAGCTTAPAPQAPVTPAVTGTYATAAALSPLVLLRTDLPDGYVMTLNQEKNATDVGSLAKSLGWQAGHVAEFTGTQDVPATMQNTIRQSLAVYPADRMASVAGLINRTDHSYPDLRYYDFPVAGLGPDARGFTGTVADAGTTGPRVEVTQAGSVVDALAGSTPQGPLGQSMAEIVFTKGSTLEVIRITGPGPGPEDVLAIARKAYAKIP